MSMKVTKEQFVGMTYDELLDENAKLVDVLHEVETEAVYAYRCLQQDCVTTAESSEHFFEKWWHAECELDRVKAENAKLREQIHWLKKGDILHVLTDQEYIDQCERERLMQVSIDALDKENAKLRELCGELLENLMPELCGKAYWPCLNRDWHKCNDGTCGNRDFVLRAQSLGVDVDGG